MSNVKWIGEVINEVIPYLVGVTVQAWPLIMIPNFSADADPTPCTRLCLQLLGRDAVRHAVSNTASLCELRVRESYHRLIDGNSNLSLSLSIFEQQINRDEPKNAATLTKRQLKQSIVKLIDDQDEMKRQLKQHW